MMFDPAYNPKTIFFFFFYLVLSVPSVSLFLALGTCVFAWSHGHAHSQNHSTHLDGGAVESLSPEVHFFSNRRGWCLNSWKPGTPSLWERAARGLWGLPIPCPPFTGTETVFLKFWGCLASPEFLHMAPLFLLPAHFSVEYRHFGRAYLMRGTELLCGVSVLSWVK